MTSSAAIPKILFIGNSLSYFNNGIWAHFKVLITYMYSFLTNCVMSEKLIVTSIHITNFKSACVAHMHIQGLCDAAQPPIEIATDKAVEPGATLAVLWSRPQPRKRMANGVSAVVLQGLYCGPPCF